ncbi:MAG: metallophosphoesterase, partial [Planctomycetota bacterium]
ALERNGDRFWLAGIDNLGRGTADVPAALDGWRNGEPAVLISHEPDAFEDAAAAGVELTLSGHTHGGQIVLGRRPPVRHTEHGWWCGRYERGDSVLFVSRGVGYSMIPVRIGSPAEVLLIRLASG